jgi:hypothetical protein
MSLHRGVVAPAVLIALAASIAIVGTRRSTATPMQDLTIRSLCYHTDGSEWICPDTSARLSGGSADVARRLAATSADVDSVVLTVYSRRGRTQRFTAPPRTDAIFLSRSAVDNFLLRYYEVTRAEEKAALVRRFLRSRTPAPR